MIQKSHVNTGWFKGKLIDSGLSQRQLAQRIGMDPAAMSLMLRGRRKMDVKEAAMVAKALGVPVEEVLRHAGVAVGDVAGAGRAPVVGWIDDHGEIHSEGVAGPMVVEAPSGYDGLVALRVQTKEVMDGWLVYYREIEGVSLEAIGRLCVVQVENGPRLIRAVRRGYAQGEYVLGGWVGEKSGSVRLSSASPVIWCRQ